MKRMKTLITAVILAFAMSGCAGYAGTSENTDQPLTAEGFEKKYSVATSAETHKVIFDTDMVFLYDDALALFELVQADKL